MLLITEKDVQFGTSCSVSTGNVACAYSLLQLIVSYVKEENVLVPIQKVLSERQKANRSHQKIPVVYRSIYREILFLIFIALGRDEIDVGKY